MLKGPKLAWGSTILFPKTFLVPGCLFFEQERFAVLMENVLIANNKSQAADSVPSLHSASVQPKVEI
jgi:hypothetical protein